MSIITKKSSFNLVRTNPSLTTNIKIVSDNEKVYLESIDADPLLSKSMYKKFEVTGGLYANDLHKFYSQGGNLLPKSIAYKTYERDEYYSIKDSYKYQYDFNYAMGVERKKSRLYTQELSIFSPLWVEPECLPDYFLIFRLKGPMSLNGLNGASYDQNNPIINGGIDLIKDPSKFFENYIKNAEIIKTFDLTNKSAIGRYIRNYTLNSLFPKYSIYASINKNDLTYWEGISYDNSGFCKKSQNIYKSYTLQDKTIIEKDSFITNGFYENGVVHPNILNLEFLFDDLTVKNYEFNRYFGLYVSEAEIGKFNLDLENTIKVSNLLLDQKIVNSNIITNDEGVIIAVDANTPADKLIKFEPNVPKFPYVKDTNGLFYSVNQQTDWDFEIGNFIRLKNNSINIDNFSNYGTPIKYVDIFESTKKGTSCFSFKVIGKVLPGDQIRIKYIDVTNPLSSRYTITGLNLPNGTNSGLGFSINGSSVDIATAICKSINAISDNTNKTQQFYAINTGNRVTVLTRTQNSYLNNTNYTLFSQAEVFPFTIPNDYASPVFVNNYLDITGSTNYLTGNLYSYHFTGGTDDIKGKFTIKQEDVLEFRGTDKVFVKNYKDNTYQEITDYSPYIDEPVKNGRGEIKSFNNIDVYYSCYLDNSILSFGVSKKIALYNRINNTNGYLSLFPIKDFDFDFYNKDYTKTADSDISKLLNFYKTNPNSPIYGTSGSNKNDILNTLFGPDCSFLSQGGYQTLLSQVDEFDNSITTLDNEYDRLKENYLNELSTESRVVPYINKWVYDNDATDIRENNYRLNTDQSFGFSNFAPSFEEYLRNKNFFTHEWYYLQKYPPYMTFDEKVNSFSYFDEDIDEALLKDVNNDYFSSYFTRNSIGGTSVSNSFKYSIFENGSDSTYAETMFRGVKLIVKDRYEYSNINYNINSLKFLNNTIYNNYKFSAVLTYSEIGTELLFIKNDKFKTITLLIKAKLDGPFFQSGSTKFIDRAHLYTIKDIYKIGTTSNSLEFDDKILTGHINKITYTQVGNGAVEWHVFAEKDLTGLLPNFKNQLAVNELGLYNDIFIQAVDRINSFVKYIKFIGIKNITSNSFDCTDIKYSIDGTNPENFLIKLLAQASDKIELNLLDNDYDNVIVSPYNSFPVGQRFPKMISSQMSGNTFVLSSMKKLFWQNPIYKSGGYNGLESTIEEISFASIADKINNGSPDVKYIEVDTNGNTLLNTFCIELVKPEQAIVSTYLRAQNLTKQFSNLQNYIGKLGYEVVQTDRTTISPINRQKGGFNPRTINLINFIDRDPNLLYQNIELSLDKSFGIIKNLYYNKVNIENANNILKIKDDNTSYPLIGEIAIDKKDYFIFNSSFDPAFYVKNLTPVSYSFVSGQAEMKEFKTFFGSKILSIPSNIKMQLFDGYIELTDLGKLSNISNVEQKIVKSIDVVKSNKILTLNVFTDELLKKYFINDGIINQFQIYLDPSYSNSKNIVEMTNNYIKENILDKYIIKAINFWEKFIPKGVSYNIIELNMTDSEKILNGYVESKSFSVQYTSDLNFDLKYNIPLDKNYSIAFTIELEKK
jgi:hypothetical protein